MRFSERFKIVTVVEPVDHQAGILSDAINMSLVYNVAFVLSFGAITGDALLKLNASAAADLSTTDIAFTYRLGSADYKAAAGDGLGAVVTVASTGLTLTAATFSNRQVVIEMDAAALPDGKPWLTLEFDATSDVLLLSAVALCNTRYQALTPPTVTSTA